MASLARSREIDLEGELDPDAVVLVVESLGDVVIARGLLEAAHFPMERVRLVSGSGKDRAARIAERYADAAQGRCAVLVDLDERNVPDAQARAREQLGDPRCEVFCAVPVAAAWLFADDRAVVDHASPDEEVQRIVKRLPLPEEIPDPKRLAHYVFGPIPSWQFITHIDIGRAAARSPSLRSFLDGMARLLRVPAPPLLEGVARHLSRDIIAGLIQEVSPADAVIWRTADGEDYTADQLQRHIEAGDAIGRQYASDLLRVSRDLLRRTASRSSPQ